MKMQNNDSNNPNDHQSDKANTSNNSSSCEQTNNLYKVNWFNGRFLTAEAFQQQDAYWEARLQALARIHPPGISYGLNIEPNGSFFTRETDSEQKLLNSAFFLTPGVAIDSSGLPIIVDKELQFSIGALAAKYTKEPRALKESSTEFSSCLCLKDEINAGKIEGAFLIIIEPYTTRSGQAKVFGNLCASDMNSTCNVDGHQSGYSLSLCRYLEGEGLKDECRQYRYNHSYSLRGHYAAHYFTEFEQSVRNQHQPKFPINNSFCDVPQKDDSAIALAMVYISGNYVLFLDQWIPRRVIANTQSTSWGQRVLGAPSEAMATARLNQFQCMLQDSLQNFLISKQIGVSEEPLTAPSLITLGFKSIPPIGFLPLGKSSLDVNTANNYIKGYFHKTNILHYSVLSLRDDDIFEDINNVFYKDAINLTCKNHIENSIKKNLDCKYFENLSICKNKTYDELLCSVYMMLSSISKNIHLFEILKREVEVVKIIIPIKYTDKNNSPEVRLAIVASMMTDNYVVYVKQRLTGLDLLIESFVSSYCCNQFDNTRDTKESESDNVITIENEISIEHSEREEILEPSVALASSIDEINAIKKIINKCELRYKNSKKLGDILIENTDKDIMKNMSSKGDAKLDFSKLLMIENSDLKDKLGGEEAFDEYLSSIRPRIYATYRKLDNINSDIIEENAFINIIKALKSPDINSLKNLDKEMTNRSKENKFLNNVEYIESIFGKKLTLMVLNESVNSNHQD